MSTGYAQHNCSNLHPEYFGLGALPKSGVSKVQKANE